ncbi:MAG: VOC family protein [Sphingomonadales bacterium]|nr:VOC family protein [Sphingomonadales bacterium]
MRAALLAIAAALALASPVAAQAPAAPSLIGPALWVGDVARSLRFYVDGLGFKVGMRMGPPERRETILTAGGDPSSPGIILLADTRPGAAPLAVVQAHGYDRTVLRIPDLAETAARLRAAGFTPGAIRDVAMGYRMMTATDPDGYRYEMVERHAPAEKAP